MIIEQSSEQYLAVAIDFQDVPCVTDVTTDLKRPVDDSGNVDKELPTYTITIKRYLPVGLNVGNYIGTTGFSLTVSDRWISYHFQHCEWVQIKRDADKDGVVETLVIHSKTLMDII